MWYIYIKCAKKFFPFIKLNVPCSMSTANLTSVHVFLLFLRINVSKKCVDRSWIRLSHTRNGWRPFSDHFPSVELEVVWLMWRTPGLSSIHCTLAFMLWRLFCESSFALEFARLNREYMEHTECTVTLCPLLLSRWYLCVVPGIIWMFVPIHHVLVLCVKGYFSLFAWQTGRYKIEYGNYIV